MSKNTCNVDANVIIIGSGMAGLYSAYLIKKKYPHLTFIILEKNSKSYIGGRASNDTFYGSNIVTGAGIGRKRKDKLLYNLLKDFDFEINEFTSNLKKSTAIDNISVDIKKIMDKLRVAYSSYKNKGSTFKEFASDILGDTEYKRFVLSSGYTDYENEDAFETLYYYGMEDNSCCWKAFSVEWKKLVLKLYHFIGEEHFKFSKNVTHINKVDFKDTNNIHDQDKLADCSTTFRNEIHTEDGIKYICNKIIIATTIQGIRNLIPNNPIYNDIEGQPFMRLYAKFSQSSIPIIEKYVQSFTTVPGPLQKIIPMDVKNGVYMIAYNDNKKSLLLKKNLKNTKSNQELYERLLEKSLGILEGSLHIIGIKSYFFDIGTHYYKPLNKKLYSNREEFIDKAQHPDEGILVVGEVVSRNQGWVEGALESVKQVVTHFDK